MEEMFPRQVFDHSKPTEYHQGKGQMEEEAESQIPNSLKKLTSLP